MHLFMLYIISTSYCMTVLSTTEQRTNISLQPPPNTRRYPLSILSKLKITLSFLAKKRDVWCDIETTTRAATCSYISVLIKSSTLCSFTYNKASSLDHGDLVLFLSHVPRTCGDLAFSLLFQLLWGHDLYISPFPCLLGT